MSDLWQRIEELYPHECICHTKGCPGYGFCGDVTVVERDPETREPLKVIDCESRECQCWTQSVMRTVQEERALVLEHAAEALSQGLRKKPRVARTLLSWARDVRKGMR